MITKSLLKKSQMLSKELTKGGHCDSTFADYLRIKLYKSLPKGVTKLWDRLKLAFFGHCDQMVVGKGLLFDSVIATKNFWYSKIFRSFRKIYYISDIPKSLDTSSTFLKFMQYFWNFKKILNILEFPENSS
jgi:hypothetical protein